MSRATVVRCLGVFAASVLGACAPRPGEKAAPAPPVIDVALGDYFFQSPDSVPAGKVIFRLNLKGPAAHVMDLVRLENGKRLPDLLAAGETAIDSSWVRSVGGGVTSASDTSPTYEITLRPGVYVMLCYFSAPDHQPHFAKGMIKEVIVRPSAQAGASTVTPDIAVKLVDYAFQLSTPITAGVHTLRVTNPSGQPHEMIIARLKDGVTMEQERARADSAHPSGPSPWENYGGVGDLAPGDTIVMTAQFAPGNYRMFCFFQGKDEKVSHAEQGMQVNFTVEQTQSVQ